MRRAVTVLTVCAAAATFAACAEEDGGDGGVGGGDGASAQDAVLAYARCMRENGVDMPDPQISEDGGMVQMKPAQGARDLDGRDPKFEKAQKACEHHMRGAIEEVDPAVRKEMEDKMLALAKCMRGEGIDFPDPVPGQGMRIDRKQGEDPRFQAAQRKCHEQVGLNAAPAVKAG